jgi:hypothetical protein
MNEDARAREPEPAVPAIARPVPTGEACRNCGAMLYGEFCYACGQPRVGWVRHLRELGADFVDSVFDIDGRLLRTLATLFFRPGRMTVEYFGGARGRYASPFRLFFVLCALAFLLLHLNVEIGAGVREDPAALAIDTAPTAEAVDRALAEAVAGLGRPAPAVAPSTAGTADSGPAAAADPSSARVERAEARLRDRAERRKRWIASRDAALAEGRAPPPDPSQPTITLGGGAPWHPTLNPLRIDGLPDAVNAALNARIGRMQRAIAAARADPEPIVAAIFAKLPLALLVVMPVFAALLKLVHWPRRRLYTEHLVVALHSHAFLFLALVLLSLVGLAGRQVAPGGALSAALDWTSRLVLLWMPLHLLLMQRRVYGGRWPRTLVEYAVTGFGWVVLVATAVSFGAIAGLMSL